MYLFGNWKMYLNHNDAVELARDLSSVSVPEGIEAIVFPNTLSFNEVDQSLGGQIGIGAQNVAWSPEGAYTGATSALMFKEAGAQYAIVGHSERRHIFGETNDDVRKKLEACISVGLNPVLCVGETKEDKEQDKAEYRIKKQLMKALEGLDLNGCSLVVAYEPVWAISNAGQGESCNPEDAARMHAWISGELKQYIDKEIPVIYGGSVKAENVLSYVSKLEIAGVLVGSASTKADSLKQIITALTP